MTTPTTSKTSSLTLIRWAIAVSFVSQFLPYADGGGYLTNPMDTDYYTGSVLTGNPGTGWQKHPMAIVVLAALAYASWSSFRERPFWRAWGHWIALGGILLCTTDAAPLRTSGGFLGVVAVGLAVAALIVRRREIAAEDGTAPPAPPAPPQA